MLLTTGRPGIQLQSYGSLFLPPTRISRKEKRAEGLLKPRDRASRGPNQSASPQEPQKVCVFPRSRTSELRHAVVHLILSLSTLKLLIFLQAAHSFPPSPNSSLHKLGSNHSYLHRAATPRCHLSVRAPFVFGRVNKEEGEGRKQEDLCIDQKCLGWKGGGRKRGREMEID